MIKNSAQKIQSTFVLGSTSTVAKAICIELAKNHHCKRFHLVSRNLERNQELVNTLENQYNAYITLEKADLIDCANIKNSKFPKVDNFELYLITAGSINNLDLARTDVSKALEITASNYSGIIPWITSIASKERISKKGMLWVFSSVAADKGRPSNYHYGAAKAALSTFCEGLFLRCVGKPFCIRIIKAGYITSSMTKGKAPKALCIDANSVAKILLRKPNRRGIEYLPWWWKLIMIIVSFMPRSITSKL